MSTARRRPSSRDGARTTTSRCTSFPWNEQHEAAGLARDALYLLRPDTYVALADASGLPDAVERYCAERGLRLAAQPG